ncbi:MAG: flagellar biosynthesis protein FlhB [Epulopiscium sp. Nele67-Bin005]|nr:MAG: flagellar biosynthesis protein FlhB [Epulopiscium sp. Nele67-Bin005]
MNIKFDLQFFASAESEGRTETATTKKREKAREEGQVAKSQELGTALLITGFFAYITVYGQSYYETIQQTFVNLFLQIPYYVLNFEKNTFLSMVGQTLIKILTINAFLFIVLAVVAFGVSYLQVGFKPSMKTMQPKFSKMNPIEGIKKLFSLSTLFELAKSIVKVVFLGAIFISILSQEMPSFFLFPDMATINVVGYLAKTIIKIGYYVGGAYLVIALLDYAYQKYKFEDSLKMSKQDVKDEYKQSEGDPQIKGKIRQKMREMSMKRMMQSVPNADVIITNPTHFAVAIFYDKENSQAPVVVAKGTDHMAAKIRELGTANKIPIVENKPLARTLYYTVEVDQAIPPELYQAVAQVLAYVYQLEEDTKNGRR